jgi:hypothetical protein
LFQFDVSATCAGSTAAEGTITLALSAGAAAGDAEGRT